MARDIADAKLRYELALIEGSAVRSAVVDSAEQARRWAAGMEAMRQTREKVRATLIDIGVPPWQIPLYYGFGMKLARLCRRFSGWTLEQAVREAADTWALRLAGAPNLRPEPREVLARIASAWSVEIAPKPL